MSERAITLASAQKVYDFLGKRYDWFASSESRAKARALDLLKLEAGQRLLEVGVGTGKEHARLVAAILPQGTAIGVDISRKMLELTACCSHSLACQADACFLPFPANSFDRLYSAYLLDILPMSYIPALLKNFYTLLKPRGRMVLVTLTEGVDFFSRALVSAWKAVYAVSPIGCAGCRPLQLSGYLQEAGFENAVQEIVVQLAVPSQILVGEK